MVRKMSSEPDLHMVFILKPEKNQKVIRGAGLQLTSEASDILCLGEALLVAAASTSTLTMLFLF